MRFFFSLDRLLASTGFAEYVGRLIKEVFGCVMDISLFISMAEKSNSEIILGIKWGIKLSSLSSYFLSTIFPATSPSALII